MRLSSRRKVDLPQPDGPISAVTCPAGITQVDALEHEVVAEPRARVRAPRAWPRRAADRRSSSTWRSRPGRGSRPEPLVDGGASESASVGPRGRGVAHEARAPASRAERGGERRPGRCGAAMRSRPMKRAMTNRTSTSSMRTRAPAKPRCDRRRPSACGCCGRRRAGRLSCGPLERVGVHEVVAERGEQQRRGLADRRGRCRARRPWSCRCARSGARPTRPCGRATRPGRGWPRAGRRAPGAARPRRSG